MSQDHTWFGSLARSSGFLAAGCVACRRRSAETHIERIYVKTGASTRSTATLLAMQHGLLDSLEPLYL
jgi:hypothetical protein